MIKRLSKAALRSPITKRLIRALVDMVTATTRWSIEGSAEGRALIEGPETLIGAIWHNRLMLVGKTWPQGKPLGMVFSAHRDGQLLADVYADRITHPILGSTRRNPAGAMKGMLRTLKDGVSVGITPDGPRGPRMRCHPGLVQAARISGAPIVPAAWSTRFRLVAGSWDRFIFALPFGRGVVIYGDPILVPRDLDEDGVRDMLSRVEAAITDVTDEADRRMGHAPIAPAPAKPAPVKPDRKIGARP
jgi:hypothetical protein